VVGGGGGRLGKKKTKKKTWKLTKGVNAGTILEKEVAEDHASVLGRLVQRGHTLRILDSVGQKMGDERERDGQGIGKKKRKFT